MKKLYFKSILLVAATIGDQETIIPLKMLSHLTTNRTSKHTRLRSGRHFVENDNSHQNAPLNWPIISSFVNRI